VNEDQEFRNVINILKQLQQVKAPAGFEADLMRRINSERVPVKRTFLQTLFIPSRIVPAAALVVAAILLVLVINNSSISVEDPFSIMPRERHDLTSSVFTENIAPVTKNKIESTPPGKEKGKEITDKDIPLPGTSAKTLSSETTSNEEAGGLQKIQALKEDRLDVSKPLEKLSETKSADMLEGKKQEREISKPSVGGNIAANAPVSDKFFSAKGTGGKTANYQISKAELNFRQIRISNEQRKELNRLRQKLESLFGK
jgi:hypothetical protein